MDDYKDDSNDDDDNKEKEKDKEKEKEKIEKKMFRIDGRGCASLHEIVFDIIVLIHKKQVKIDKKNHQNSYLFIDQSLYFCLQVLRRGGHYYTNIYDWYKNILPTLTTKHTQQLFTRLFIEI